MCLYLMQFDTKVLYKIKEWFVWNSDEIQCKNWTQYERNMLERKVIKYLFYYICCRC